MFCQTATQMLRIEDSSTSHSIMGTLTRQSASRIGIPSRAICKFITYLNHVNLMLLELISNCSKLRPGSGMNNGLFHPNQSVVSDETTLPNISQIQQDQSRSRVSDPARVQITSDTLISLEASNILRALGRKPR